jgi:WD40 repeat protein
LLNIFKYFLGGHTDIVNSFTSFGNKGLFASGSQDTLIKIWDSKEGVLVQTLDEKNGGKIT